MDFKLRSRLGVAHREIQPYTDLELMNDAKRYTSRSQWCLAGIKERKKGKFSHYGAAIKHGRAFMRQCCSHMPRVIKVKHYKYSDTDLLASARQFQTRTAWKRGADAHYQSARIRPIWDACVAHMRPAANPFGKDYIVYAYEFSDRSCYVGLTFVPEDRKYRHRQKGPVFEHCKICPDPIYKVLATGLTCQEAQRAEEYWQAQYQTDLWKALHVAPPGSLGLPKRSKWTKEAVLAEAKKYPTKQAWIDGSQFSYRLAKRKKWFDEAASHMPKHDVQHLIGRAVSAESRAKMSQAKLGMKQSVLTRQRRSATIQALWARKRHPEQYALQQEFLANIQKPDQPELKTVEPARNSFFAFIHRCAPVMQILQDDNFLCLHPERKVAIELNEHDALISNRNEDSERLRGVNKIKCFADQGVSLWIIASYDWLARPSAIKNLIEYRLGMAQRCCAAREADLIEVESSKAAEFYDQYHLQGQPNGGRNFGLCFQENLVACMTFTRSAPERRKVMEPGSHNLSRFAVAGSVPGAASRLFKHAVETLAAASVVSYSDNAYASGRLYETLGFNLAGTVPPDYRVWHPHYGVKHKSFWQRKCLPLRLQELKVADTYDPATDPRTEFDMTASLGCRHIWDCGKKRWAWRRIPLDNPA